MNIFLIVIFFCIVFSFLTFLVRDEHTPDKLTHWGEAFLLFPANALYISCLILYIIFSYPFRMVWGFGKHLFKPLTPNQFEKLWADRSVNLTYLFGSIWFYHNTKDVPKLQKFKLVRVSS